MATVDWLRRRRREPLHAPGPTTGPREQLAADVALMADQFVADHGGRADLDRSLASLRVVDDLLEQRRRRGERLDPADQWLAAAYVMECARLAYGGEYEDAFDAEDPIVLVVGRPRFEAVLGAISKVAGRVRNGPEDDLPFFVDGLAGLIARRESGFVT